MKLENNQGILPGAEQKINEYIERIKRGESIDSLQLPPNMRNAVERGLEKPKEQEVKFETKKLAIIPPQYDGLDSETLDFIWTIPEYVDPEKTKQEQERKAKAFEYLQEQEEKVLAREEKKLQEQKVIEELRKQLHIPGSENITEKILDPKVEELRSRIEQYQVSLPNLDSIVKNEGGHLEVIINGKKIDFDKFEIVIDPPEFPSRSATVGFIEKKNKTEDKGIGLPIYLELGRRLAEKGIGFEPSHVQYGQGKSIWMNLAKLGFARNENGQLAFFNNHEGILEKNLNPEISKESNPESGDIFIDTIETPGKTVEGGRNTESTPEKNSEITPKLNITESATTHESQEDIGKVVTILDGVIEKTKQYEEAKKKITEEITKQFQKGLTPISNQMNDRMWEKINKEVGYYAKYNLGFTIDDLNRQMKDLTENLRRKYDLTEFLKETPNLSLTFAEKFKTYLTSHSLTPKTPGNGVVYPDINISI